MKRLLLLLSGVFSVIFAFTINDSITLRLENKLQECNNADAKIEILKELVLRLKYKKPEKAKSYINYALKVSKNSSKESIPYFHNILGDIYRNSAAFDSAGFSYNRAKLKGLQLGNTLETAYAYMGLGLIQKDLSNTDSAMKLYSKAESIINNALSGKYSVKYMDLLISLKNNKAVVYDDKLKALEELLEAERLSDENNINSYYQSLYSNIANIFFEIKDYDKALIYNKKTLALDIQHKNEDWLAYDYSVIANLFSNLNLPDSSLYYAVKSVEYAKKYPSDINQLCFSYIVLSGIQNNIYEFSKALTNSLRSLELAKKLKNVEFQIYSHTNLATAYLHLNMDFEAESHLKDALLLLKKVSMPAGEEETYGLFMRLFYKTGELNKALKYSHLYDSVREKIVEEKQIKAVYDIKTKYETEKKEKAILQLSNENLKKEANLVFYKMVLAVVFSIFVILFILFIFIRLKQKKEARVRLLEDIINTREEEKQKIGKELHDGIASRVLKLVYETENTDSSMTDKLLEVYNGIRNLSHKLDNTPMHDVSFFERILELIPENIKDKTFKLSITPKDLILKEPYGTHFYRIIQELITNNLKYSESDNTNINIYKNNGSLKFQYSDNGVGIENLKKRNGLRNIEERVELMGGSLEYNLQGQGLEISFKIPYEV